MGSMDAEVEIDMEISDDEQESSKARVRAGPVVDGRGLKRSASGEPELTDKTDSSRKRKRSSSVEASPSVRVEYRNLSRESRKKLQEVLRDWSLWQGYHSRNAPLETRNHVENGEEQYYPALQVGPVGSSFSVTFWVDKPAKQARNKESGDTKGIVRTNSEDLRENEAEVPLYDRVTSSLPSQESNKDGRVEIEREAARCFNCGSYSHALRDCKRQWNYDAINSARSNHAAKRTFSSGPRSATRYYEAQHSNENQEPDRAPWQLYQSGEHGHPTSNFGKEASGIILGSAKKPDITNKLPSTDDNEEGEIVDGGGSPCDEEESYIAFSPDAPTQVDRSPDFSGVRVPYNSSPERMWRSPPTYSPPSQLHPNYHHQRPFAYSPPNHVYPHTPSPHTPSPVHYSGMHHQRVWDERQPHRLWEERSPYYSENNMSPAVNVPSTPIPIPVIKKEDDDWELNFESSVHQSESSRSHSGAPVVTDQSTPSPVRHQALTVNTVSEFSPPDPSQLSPTGSGYGDSFRPSPVPQTPVQYHFSYHTTAGREATSYSTEAWEKAQAALSSMESDGTGGGL